jgi:tRNA 2-selenouridine synthase
MPLPRDWRRWSTAGAAASARAAWRWCWQIGFRTVQLLEGGYKAFRARRARRARDAAAALDLRVLCGRTGSGKSRLLQALAAAGAQVLDLEALACHRGSVLGPLPGCRSRRRSLRDAAVAGAARLRPGAAGLRRKARAAPSAACACPSRC